MISFETRTRMEELEKSIRTYFLWLMKMKLTGKSKK